LCHRILRKHPHSPAATAPTGGVRKGRGLCARDARRNGDRARLRRRRADPRLRVHAIDQRHRRSDPRRQTGPHPEADRMSRRWSGRWGREPEPLEPVVEVLIPTVGRAAELSATLAGLAAQEDPPFDVVISDQSANGIRGEPSDAAMLRVLEAQGRGVRVERHLPRRGMAEQRSFLLGSSRAKYVLFLDDDVWCEPGLLGRLLDAIRRLGCGFVGSAVQGLSYLGDERPDEQEPLEFFHGRVEPETIRRHSPGFQRLNLHNAANLTHIAAQMDIVPGGWRAYRVAWVGGCCLFNRDALVASGGFDVWVALPPGH